MLGNIFAFSLGFLATCTALSPAYARRSADAFKLDTHGDRKRWLITFARRKPNRLMQRINQDTPVDYIGMLPPNTMYYGETAEAALKMPVRSKELPEYWDIVPQSDKYLGDRPERFQSFWFMRWLVKYINFFAKVNLIGLRGYYDVTTMSIEKMRYEQKTDNEGNVYYDLIPPRKDEITDHVRTGPFQWVVQVVKAETQDGVQWNVLLVVNPFCINPARAFNKTENWSQFLSNAIKDVTRRAFQTLKTDEVIHIDKGKVGHAEAGDQVVQAIYQVDNTLRNQIGFTLSKAAAIDSEEYSGGVQILAIDPYFKEKEDEKAFRAVWRAVREAEAMTKLSEGEKEREINLGKGEADRESRVFKAMADAAAEVAKKHPEHAELVQRLQALENVAKHGNTMFFDTSMGASGGDTTTKMLAAILKELQKGKK